MLKRCFDVLSSLVVLFFLWPFFLLTALLIKLEDAGPVFYLQERVGINGTLFKIFKFRTMVIDADKKGLKITVGMRDPRITRIGYYLRRFKLDELPQLLNILKGDMSVVGPRPEVKRYVDIYNQEQKEVLSVRPGLTDYASLEYIDENKILAKAVDPEREYIQVIMPAKLALNLRYIHEKSFWLDMKLIFKTFAKIL
jgi:lipopolysaccharide/colanic/teichoic acid biosynthesis glycosyltransferase